MIYEFSTDVPWGHMDYEQDGVHCHLCGNVAKHWKLLDTTIGQREIALCCHHYGWYQGNVAICLSDGEI